MGTTTPVNTLDVNGTAAIGTYAGANTAPSNSLIVSGNIGIGTNNPGTLLDIKGNTPIINLNDTGGGGRQFQLMSKSGTFYLKNNSGTSGSWRFDTNTNIDVVTIASGSNGPAIGIGNNNNSPVGALDVRAGNGTTSIATISGSTSFAGLVVDNSGSGDLFTASHAGVPTFTLNNYGAITDSNYQIAGGVLYTDGTGLFKQIAGNATQILQSNGSTLSWVDPGTLPSSNFWNQANGTIYQKLPTQDLLLGGISTSSASFHVFGSGALQGTNPVASIAANTSFAGLVVDNSGTGDIFTASSSGLNRFVIQQNGTVGINVVQSGSNGTLYVKSPYAHSAGASDPILVLDQPSGGTHTSMKLAISGSTQGIIDVDSNNFKLYSTAANAGSISLGANNKQNQLYISGSNATSGQVGINNTSPLALLDVKAFGGVQSISGTIPVASISGQTSFAGLVVDNSGNGDLFTASSSGLNRFVITQAGNVGYWDNVPSERARILGRFAGSIG